MPKYYFTAFLLVLSVCLTAQNNDNSLPTRDSTVNYQVQPPVTNDLGDYNTAYYQLEELNPGLTDPPPGVNLQTPRAALEYFIRNARAKDYAAAARALNFNLLPANLRQEQAATLAEKLHYVVRQRVPLSWDALPDRPDGQTNRSTTQPAVEGEPRRSISFGQLDVDGRSITLSVQRVRVGDDSPRWVISAATVDNVEAMYAAYGPTWINRALPAWTEQKVLGVKVWKLLGLLIFALLSYFAGRLIYRGVAWLVRRSETAWIDDLGNKMATPISVALGSLMFYLALNDLLSITGNWSPYLYSFLLVVVIVSLTWLLMRVIDYVIERITATQVADVSDEENLQSRRLLTYISVARWVFTAIIVAVGGSVVLSQFPQLHNLGISLMASAGLATIIIGVAAQSTLGNIVAGLQIAVTRPARIGDSIITHDGEYGTVEDIRFTYLVVKTWDARRLVIPLKHFIDNPFQNWSMNDPHMLKPIILYADYRVDVDQVRNKFRELCRAHELFDDEGEPTVQVVGSDKEVIRIRCLASARDSSSAWTLHVDLREAMVRYLAGLDNGHYLARERKELVGKREDAIVAPGSQ